MQWPSLPGGCLFPEGVVSQHALRQIPPPRGQTDTCKNITFATSLRTVIRKHSSRMRTACLCQLYPLLQLPLDVSCREESKERVSSDGHQMSLAEGVGCSGLMSGAGAREGESNEQVWTDLMSSGGGLCTVRSSASWVMITWDLPPVDRWTHKNITFPQLRWLAVNMQCDLWKTPEAHKYATNDLVLHATFY